MKLKYTPEAIRDLQETKTYISKVLHNPKAAERITRNILNQCGRLKDHPNLGMSLSAKLDYETDLRYLICENHIAIYRIADDWIMVVRVLDGRTDYLRILFHQ